MKEIKFRAFNVITKTMIDLKKVTPLALNIDTDGLFIPFSDGLPVMQYTGLKDKNGKEIYEEDILKYFDEVGVVKYSFYELHKSYIPCWCACRKVLTIDDKQRVVVDAEVVGNIYETPELIDAKTLTK